MPEEEPITFTRSELDALGDMLRHELEGYWEVLKDEEDTLEAALALYDADPLVIALNKLNAIVADKLRATDPLEEPMTQDEVLQQLFAIYPEFTFKKPGDTMLSFEGNDLADRKTARDALWDLIDEVGELAGKTGTFEVVRVMDAHVAAITAGIIPDDIEVDEKFPGLHDSRVIVPVDLEPYDSDLPPEYVLVLKLSN